jgi:hypothetical protein
MGRKRTKKDKVVSFHNSLPVHGCQNFESLPTSLFCVWNQLRISDRSQASGNKNLNFFTVSFSLAKEAEPIAK